MAAQKRLTSFFSSTAEDSATSQGKSTASSAGEEREKNLFQDEASTSADSAPKSKNHGCFLISGWTSTCGYDGTINCVA